MKTLSVRCDTNHCAFIETPEVESTCAAAKLAVSFSLVRLHCEIEATDKAGIYNEHCKRDRLHDP